jgi:hypothetical protein
MQKSILFIAFLFFQISLFSQIISEPFEFRFENKTLRGLIEKPKFKKSKAVVVIIPGYGKTNFVEGKWYSKLRNNFIESGLTVVLWDKMGCGNSDGIFDAQQPVENSAQEALAAIQKIKKLNLGGSEKIGLWGLSRAGWICPLINELHPIDFWISVSGTDDKENYGYLLKSNLIIAGKKESEVEKLYNSWMLAHKIYNTKGTYEAYLKALKPLAQDSLCKKLFGFKERKITDEGRRNYLKNQKSYTGKGYFDTKSGLWVYLENFNKILCKINAPVLALFGRQDSQVNWRKTKQIYENTIAKNPKATLTSKVFDNCNHSLQKCKTCAYIEDLSALNWVACDGYYTTMNTWLKKQKFID